MIFEGVGEYRCEKCGKLDYDDYGKVRRFLETNGTANMTQISGYTGVTVSAIKRMVREARFTIASDSPAFLTCERCGERIYSGMYCQRCETFLHRQIEQEEKEKRQSHIQGGFSVDKHEAKGERRFSR